MSRRGMSLSMPCQHPGCRDTELYEPRTKAEYYELEKKRPGHRCVLHSRLEEWLSPKNGPGLYRTEFVLVATKLTYDFGRETGIPLPGLFWVPVGSESGNGFAHGPGFRASASEFPEGTRLRVTATVELPDESVR